ncbi:hypothetical protein THAOC_07705 [Thalassiosira oceanica]|uniref:Uncharacterized protein n=1 Tax=Thalassiosira oceanica TaxID=159749 RepID=K0T129_THAOC|nr:hypothetical protein THAOC_07705 [Thalassiosira oceanica]|eukprot:EJK70899.1 hypothetical protein THAOC_07705 [Thalassiosira oceanica]
MALGKLLELLAAESRQIQEREESSFKSGETNRAASALAPEAKIEPFASPLGDIAWGQDGFYRRRRKETDTADTASAWLLTRC